MKTSIVIPCWNQLSMTQQCMEALDAFTPESHEVIFVDNGSTDGTGEWLASYCATHPNRTVISNPKNLGFPIACNQGAAFATGDYILFLNNDVIVSRDWLTGLIDCAKSADDIAIVGPRTNSISGPQMVTEIVTGYDTIEKFISFADSFRKTFKGAYQPYWRIVGFCMLMPTKIFNELGGFDERYTPGNFEDDDLCMKAVKRGYRNLICCDVFVHHHGSASHNKDTYSEIISKNERKFDHKWNNKTNTISAVMIVKNEEKFIEACLKSMHDDVEEIIVVDTGSTDKTIDICKRFSKVKVFNYKWVDDFGAARQFANDQATMDWCFSIDADEVVTGLKEWKSQFKAFTAYRVCTRNYTTNISFANLVYNKGEYKEEVGVGWFPSEKVRVWPNDKRVQWEYPVHEVVENSIYYLGMGLVTPPDLIIHHYGRMQDTYDAERSEKYYDYLHKQWKSGKNDLRSLEQLATQAQGMGKYKEALEFWKRVLEINPEHVDAPMNMCHVNEKLGNMKEAHGWAIRRFILAPDNRDSMQNLAYTSFSTGDLVLAKALATRILKDHKENVVARYILDNIQTINP